MTKRRICPLPARRQSSQSVSIPVVLSTDTSQNLSDFEPIRKPLLALVQTTSPLLLSPVATQGHRHLLPTHSHPFHHVSPVRPVLPLVLVDTRLFFELFSCQACFGFDPTPTVS
jgi:hypothetical protein